MKKLLFAFLLFASFAFPQAATYSARRIQSGTTLPIGCSVGPFTDVFIKTDAAAGQQVYLCTVGNNPGTWTQQGGGSGVTCDSTTDVLKGNNAGGCIAAIPGTDYALPGTTPTPGYQPNQPLSGCGVEYTSGLSFTVGACTYTIAGVTYTSPVTTITLNAADPSNPRIDVIYVDDSSTVGKLTGTPAMSPAQPSVDPGTQLGLIFITVAAGATTPSGVTVTPLYQENTEWTCSSTANINCNSTNNPYRGTKDIEATSAVLGNNFTLVKPAAGTVNLATQNYLVLYIRSKAAWPTGTGANATRTLSLFWLNGSTQVGQAVVIRDNAFGFLSSTTGSYQQIAIPISLFGAGSNLVTTLKAQITGRSGSSSIGFYIDEVSLQSGTNSFVLPQTLMNFRGVWSSSTAYSPNDLVTYQGNAYVALASNTGSTPPSTSWQQLAGDYTLNGGVYMKGTTSGGLALSVANIAGTAITMIMPATNATTGQQLYDSGAITCPTNLPSYFPSTCHQFAWLTIGGVAPNSLTGAPVAAVPLTGWSYINQGNSQVDNFSSSGIYYAIGDTTALNLRMYKRSLNAASTYTVYASLDCRMADPGASSQACGVYLYDGTKAEGIEALAQCGTVSGTTCVVGVGGVSAGGSVQLRVQQYSNVTTASSTVAGPTGNLVGSAFSIKIVEDGVHRTFFYWTNGAWVQFFQENTNTFLTPTDIAIGGISATGTTSYYIGAHLNYWYCTAGC